jgi:dinuclear metal center YbgI/SA1388 family protein
MPEIKEIIDVLEAFAPPSFQESYDNCGALTGQIDSECTGVLFALDCTEAVVLEAIQNKCNLIVAHHPILFSGLKKITGETYVERTIILAIQNSICIYAMHTNLDNVVGGVNAMLANKLGLSNLKVLAPKAGLLSKLVTYVPEKNHQTVLEALFKAGCGNIGNYSHCSFNSKGTGTFMGNSQTNPFSGEPEKLSIDPEVKVETVFYTHQKSKVIKALLANHPYEEVAYDIFHNNIDNQFIGSGMIGELPVEIDEVDFLTLIKENLNLKFLKHTNFTRKSIKKVALCGGSGVFLLKNAINSGADAFLTADIKYHEFFDADNKLLLIDAGHYETEQFTPEIFYSIIQNKFPTFAIRLSKINTNPVNYF